MIDDNDDFGVLPEFLALPLDEDWIKDWMDDESVGGLLSNDVQLAEASPESGFSLSSISPAASPHVTSSSKPFLEIIEEPEELFKFRYAREAPVPHGPIRGCKSSKQGTSKKKTNFGPKVKLHNFFEDAVIRCWLTQSGTPKAHVHQLVVTGKKVSNETRGPHDVAVDASNNYTASFDHLNIIHAVTDSPDDQFDYWRRKNLIDLDFSATVESIQTPLDRDVIRKEIKGADKNFASLYFEAFALIDGQLKRVCEPVISRKIKNTKSPKSNVLSIYKHFPSQGSCMGNEDMVLLVEKIVKDVVIRFYELDEEGVEIWREEVNPDDIYKQVAIVFRSPPYRDKQISETTEVCFKIVRRSTGDESDERKFLYVPSPLRFSIGKKRRMDELNAWGFPRLMKENLEDEESSGEWGVRHRLVEMDCLPRAQADFGDVPSLMHSRPMYVAESAAPQICYKVESLPIDENHCASCTYCTTQKNWKQEAHRKLHRRVLNVTSSTTREVLDAYNEAGETVLEAAIKNGYTEEVKAILRTFPDYIDKKSLTGKDSPFHIAVKNRRRDITEFLLEMKFNWNVLNGFNLTPLHYAVRLEYADIIVLLLTKSKVNIKPKLNGTRSSGGDVDYTSDLDVANCGATNEPQVLKGPCLNDFTSDKTILKLLQKLSTPPLTIEDLEMGRAADMRKVCSKLAKDLKIHFAPAVRSKKPFSFIKNYMARNYGPKEAAVKIQKALNKLSLD